MLADSNKDCRMMMVSTTDDDIRLCLAPHESFTAGRSVWACADRVLLVKALLLVSLASCLELWWRGPLPDRASVRQPWWKFRTVRANTSCPWAGRLLPRDVTGP